MTPQLLVDKIHSLEGVAEKVYLRGQLRVIVRDHEGSWWALPHEFLQEVVQSNLQNVRDLMILLDDEGVTDEEREELQWEFDHFQFRFVPSQAGDGYGRYVLTAEEAQSLGLE